MIIQKNDKDQQKCELCAEKSVKWMLWVISFVSQAFLFHQALVLLVQQPDHLPPGGLGPGLVLWTWPGERPVGWKQHFRKKRRKCCITVLKVLKNIQTYFTLVIYLYLRNLAICFRASLKREKE